MAKLDFALKVVSPAFVAGAMEKNEQTQYADQQGKTIFAIHRFIEKDGDGLRIPSLRGVLRFWFRAMNGQLAVAGLKTAEAEMFGDTERGQGIRIIPNGIENWRAEKIAGDNSLGYLGYGPVANVPGGGSSSHHKNSTREAVMPETIFKFRAIGHRPEQIQALKKCLLLLHLFGGIGSRSRRAWGSLAVSGDFIPPLEPNEPIAAWFEKTLRKIWPERAKPSGQQKLPSFSAFFAESAVRLSAPRSNYKDVMQEFYQRFKQTRLYNINNPAASPPIAKTDHDWEARDSAGQDVLDVPQRLAFGMPYSPSSRKNHWSISYKGYSPKRNEPPIDRRASPLFLKVFQGPDQKLYAVSLFLKAEFFGAQNIEIGQDPAGKKKIFPGWKAVEEFMNCPKWQTVNLP